MAEPKTRDDLEQEALDLLLDDELEDSFPASDPPSALLREPHDPPKPA